LVETGEEAAGDLLGDGDVVKRRGRDEGREEGEVVGPQPVFWRLGDVELGGDGRLLPRLPEKRQPLRGSSRRAASDGARPDA
jgi:hypothetical protein